MVNDHILWPTRCCRQKKKMPAASIETLMKSQRTTSCAVQPPKQQHEQPNLVGIMYQTSLETILPLRVPLGALTAVSDTFHFFLPLVLGLGTLRRGSRVEWWWPTTSPPVPPCGAQHAPDGARPAAAGLGHPSGRVARSARPPACPPAPPARPPARPTHTLSTPRRRRRRPRFFWLPRCCECVRKRKNTPPCGSLPTRRAAYDARVPVDR